MDAATGTQLWAEAYDREIVDGQGSAGQSGDAGTFQLQTFKIQDDLTDHIVTSVADGYGVLVRSMAAPTRDRKVEELSASELVLRYYAFLQQIDPEEHAVLRAGLEQALEREPNHATAWACLSNLYQLEYFDRFNPREKPLERSREAAWRAVKIDPACQMGWKEIAAVHFFSRDFPAFRETAERAMSLNPRDGSTLAMMAIMIAFSGEWERGMALAQRAIELNRHHPGWYHNVAFHHHYRKGEYEAALQAAKKINMPEFHWMHLATAAACGMLERHEEARTAIESLRKYTPTFLDLANVREDVGLWDPDKDDVERFLQGLQKAGLKYDSEDSAAAADSTATDSIATKIEPKLKSDPAAAGTASIATATASGASRADEGFWVAVLPFKYTGASAELKALADGLSEEIVTGLSRFSYLRVIARGSTAKYSSEAGDIRAVGKELGARYVMEGSIRQAGAKVRLAVQLVDAVSGAHLWAENYERTFSPEAVFGLQDDLVPRIVSTVADMNGTLPRSMSAAVRGGDPEQLTPYEAVLRSFGYFERVTPEDLAAALFGLEAAVRKAPAYGDAWAMLALLHVQNYAQGFGLQADALTKGINAARQAVAAAPSNHLAHFSLAQALFFQKEFPSFRNAAERAVELNPMDGNSLALLAEFFTYSGDAERGLALADRAKQLNPNHPGWYWHVNFNHAYRLGDYKDALSFILKSNMTENWGRWALMAAAYGQLGERKAASKALQELLRLRPDIGNTIQREAVKWFDAEHGAHLMEGFQKAGLEIAGLQIGNDPAKPASTKSAAIASVTTSGATRASVREDEGFWVAVLPFKYTGDNRDLKALAEGLSEEVITGLSRFSYLRVIARGSTAKYSSESGDVRAIGKELSARYVMEGSLRQAGSKLRLAVQLVDATTGTHLWAETYERVFTPESIFEVQDELVPRIVSTVADQYGVLPRSMSDVLRNKSEDSLTPHEAVLRAFSYFTRITPEEHAAVRKILERAVREAPDHADSWAMLSMLYRGEFAQGYNAGPNPLDRALAAAQHAVDLAPTHALGHYTLATVYFFRKEMIPFQVEAERALALNPLDAGAKAYLGLLTATSGDWERGCQMVESAVQLNPNCPGYFYFAGACNAYRQGKYEEVLEAAARINMPNYYQVPALRAAALGQLCRLDEAHKAVQDLLALRPDFATVARREYYKWYNSELIEHIIDGLRKAGLEIAPSQADRQAPALAKSTNASARSADSKTPSIAVLPFANMSADEDQEYFSDDLAEEIINLLARIPSLKVIARTSAFAFRGKEQDIRGIADTLGVTHVLEGSVRRVDNRLRITGQLIDAADGTHLWSERYDREMTDIFAVQDEIAAAIVGALRVKLSGEAPSKRYEPKLAAYEAYLKGKYHQATVTPESLELAKRCYEHAIALDPSFGLARIGVGFYWLAMTIFGRRPAREAVLAARAEAQHALLIDPALPDAHALLGYLAAIYDLDWAEAEKHFEFPMAKQVGTTITRPLYAWFQYLRGNVVEAIALAERAIGEDPLDVWSRMNLHAYLQAAGREEEALEQLKKVLELDGNQAVAMVSRAMILADQGSLEEALATARRAHSIGPWLPETAGVLAGLLRRHGHDAESESIAKAMGSGKTLGDARTQAIFHLLCGEINEGADWAEKAINEYDLSMRMIYLRFVVCKELRASQRWAKIAKMINLPQP